MFDYFEQFNKLDPKIKEKVSNQFMVKIIDDLEKKYGVDLASTVMMVMAKAVLIDDLALHLSDQFSLSEVKAKNLAFDLGEQVFLGVADYLNMDLSQLFSAKISEPYEAVVKPVAVSASNSYDQEIDNAIRTTIIEMNLDLPLEVSEKLNSVLKLYWRGVRNKIDTRALLLKPTSDSGFALSELIIDALIFALDKKKNVNIDKKQAALKKPSSGVLEKIAELTKNSSRMEADYNLASALDTKHELSSGIDLSREIAPIKLVAPVIPKTESKPDLLSVMEKAAVASPVIAPVVSPTPVAKIQPVTPKVVLAPVVSPTESKIKPRVEDIKPIRIMNPIDELRYLDLVNFRRMSRDPVGITKKIKSRIKLLEGEDYEKGLAGITAWRQSSVNKLYLKIINASMSEGQTIPLIIEDLKSKKQDFLTLAEMEAIISLNSDLKF